MFKRRNTSGDITIYFEGQPVRCADGETVAAALLAAGIKSTRLTPKHGAPRLPFCMMGVCFDCLVEIDGIPNQQACLTVVESGMHVARQTVVNWSLWT